MAKKLTIFGDASVGGGEFGKVRVFGDGIIQTDVIAKSIKVFGSATFYGSVNANKVQIYGSVVFNEAVNCGQVKLYGAAVFKKSAKIEQLVVRGAGEFLQDAVVETVKNSGALEVGGSLMAKEVKSYGVIQGKGKIKVETLLSAGVLETKGELEGERITIKGAIHHANLINGEEILIELNERCQCHSIGASKLVVALNKRKRRTKFTIYKGVEKQEVVDSDDVHPFQRVLVAHEIEGDQLELMSTHAKVVRGDMVNIGAHSKIDVVEYSTSLKIDESAEILQQVRN